jgi:nitroimidazol reductase NimA-like FMN-containing flavoprotein (pyridoxamine 5'-phosphate oxidase superfamily)
MSTTNTPQAAPTIPPFVNAIVRAILRSPLHKIMSHNIMLLSFTGRKSGKRYAIPVSYVREDDTFICFTDSRWWKNLRGGTPVTLLVKGQELEAIATPLADDKEAIANHLRTFLQKLPRDAKFHSVRLSSTGQPDPDDVARAAQTDVMIQVQLVTSQM